MSIITKSQKIPLQNSSSQGSLWISGRNFLNNPSNLIELSIGAVCSIMAG